MPQSGDSWALLELPRDPFIGDLFAIISVIPSDSMNARLWRCCAAMLWHRCSSVLKRATLHTRRRRRRGTSSGIRRRKLNDGARVALGRTCLFAGRVAKTVPGLAGGTASVPPTVTGSCPGPDAIGRASAFSAALPPCGDCAETVLKPMPNSPQQPATAISSQMAATRLLAASCDASAIGQRPSRKASGTIPCPPLLLP